METKTHSKRWEAYPIKHEGKWRIAVVFEKDPGLIARIKRLEGARWSKSLGVWHLPDTPAYRERFGLAPLVILNEAHQKRIVEFQNWLRSRRYSENTVKVYAEALKSFLFFFNTKRVEEIHTEDVIRYNNEFILKNNLSASYQNQIVNAIKLFFSNIENRKLDPALVHRPKREKPLPNVLSKEEVKMILNAPVNAKHRTMLSLIYSCGLRRNELLNLKPMDIDSKRGIVTIRQGKGKKDRIVPLSEKILAMLRDYYVKYKPQTWLFEGQKPNTQYDERSLASVLKQALEKSKIKKPVTLHWLRHSYATHLLESGTDLRYIQELLGHKSSKTTEIYTHVSTQQIQKIKSPFDDLDL
jgi:integrase/recombinase XerD